MPTAMKTMAGMGSSREGLLTGAGVGVPGLEEAWMSTGGRDDKEVGEAAGTQKYQGDTEVAGKGEERPPDGGVSGQDYTFWSPKPPFPRSSPFQHHTGLVVIPDLTQTH